MRACVLAEIGVMEKTLWGVRVVMGKGAGAAGGERAAGKGWEGTSMNKNVATRHRLRLPLIEG